MGAIDGVGRAAALALVVVVAGCGAGTAGRAGGDDEYYRASSDRERPAPPRPTAEPVRDEPAAAEVRPVLVRRAPTSSGPLDGDAAGAVVFASAGELGACHRAAVSTAGGGVLYALLDVTAAGEVEGVLIGHSDVRDMRFLDCVQGVLEGLAMPAAAAPSVVQTHIVFGARDEAEARVMLRAYRAARASGDAEGDEARPMTAVREAVQGCAERVFRGRIESGGRIVLQIALGEGGRVGSVSIGEDAFEGRLDACVVTAVEKLRLAVEEDAGPAISYPVIIQPTGEGGAPAPAVEARPGAAPPSEG